MKASDITKNSEVEIINPDLVLAHITDMSGKLNMEISVSAGRGYRTVDQIEDKKKEVGYIDIDSIDMAIFSPPYANCFDYCEVYKINTIEKLKMKGVF